MAMFGEWIFQSGGFTSSVFNHRFVDPRMDILRQRVLDRVNSDQRFVHYILRTYGTLDGEPFFQALCQHEREVCAAFARRDAERANAGRFTPSAGQTEVQPGRSPREPDPLVVEEVPLLDFLPWIRAAASRTRGSK